MMNTFKVDWKKLRHAPLLPLLSRETEWSTLDVLAYLRVSLCPSDAQSPHGLKRATQSFIGAVLNGGVPLVADALGYQWT